MSSIVGVVNGSCPELTVKMLDALLSRSGSPGGQAVEAVVSGHIALAMTNPLPGPWHAEGHTERGVMLAVCGRLFEEGLADCQGRPSPRELLARFCSRGVAGLQGLNGDYLVAVWEKGPKRLTIVNDRLGLRRLYYWASGGRLAFAPSLSAFTALPGFPKTIDECALADYLATGHHLDGRTWYSAVQLLLPASVLTFSDGHLSLSTYWQLGQGSLATRRADGIEELESFVEIAISRRLPLLEMPVKVWGDASSPSKILLTLLQRGGRTVEPIASPNGQIHATRVHCLSSIGSGRRIRIAEHSLPCHGAQLLHVRDALHGDEGTVFTAHPAQLFSPLHFRFRGRRSQPDQLVSLLCRPLLPQEEIRQLLRPEVYRLIQGVTADSIARAYRKAPGESIAAKAPAVFLRQHQQHLTPFDLEQHAPGCRVAAPFTDRAVVEAALSAFAAQRTEESSRLDDLDPTPDTIGELPSHAHPAWPIDQLVDLVEHSLGTFFRVPKLREFLSRSADDQSASEKLCAIAGVCLAFDAFSDNPRVQHEPALTGGRQ